MQTMESDPQTQPSAAQARPAGGRRVLTRKDGRTLNRTTLYLQPDLARRLAVRSAETGQDQSEIVAEALLAHLAKGGV